MNRFRLHQIIEVTNPSVLIRSLAGMTGEVVELRSPAGDSAYCRMDAEVPPALRVGRDPFRAMLFADEVREIGSARPRAGVAA